MSRARARDAASFERETGFSGGAMPQSPPNESHAVYWLFYPLTLLECAAMAVVAAFSYLLLRVLYFSWWHPESAKVRPPGRVKPQLDTEDALRAMQAVEDIARQSGAQVYWISGTLLGLERLGRPLPHDNDLDLGINTADPRCLDLVRALWASDSIVEIAPQRISRKIRIQNPDLQHVANCIIRYKAAVRTGDEPGKPAVKIDIFLHFPYCGGLMHGTRNSLWWNSTLDVARKSYGSGAFSVPADPHRYLLENYGDYRTEVKEFENSIDCPNAMNIFSWQSLGYLLARLQLMVKLGKLERARRVNRRIRATIRKGLSPFDGRAPRRQPLAT
jgi:hypothetical protein